MRQIPDSLKDAYFELVLYPVRGASLLNRYQLLSRRSLARADRDPDAAMRDALHASQAHNALNEWTRKYNEDICNGKWQCFFDWHPYHWTRSTKMDAPICDDELIEVISRSPKPRFIDVAEALSDKGAQVTSDIEGEIPIWIEAITPIRNFSKTPENNVFCTVTCDSNSFEASATPINNIWHATHVGPMWSNVGSIRLKKGLNVIRLKDIRTDARIDSIFLGFYPPFPQTCMQIIPAAEFVAKHDTREGSIKRIAQLGFSEGVEVLPFTTPSYDLSNPEDVPFVDYNLQLSKGRNEIEICMLPTLHIHEGRDARYAVQFGEGIPEVQSIHTDDFSAEWRLNVLRGYSSRKFIVNAEHDEQQTLRIFLLDPGIVIQEIRVNQPSNSL